MQNIGSPVLIVASLALFIWAWAAVGSFSEIIEEMSIISANYTSSGNSTNTGDSTPQYTTSQVCFFLQWHVLNVSGNVVGRKCHSRKLVHISLDKC